VLVLRRGFEPLRPFGHQALNLERLPFRHLSISKYSMRIAELLLLEDQPVRNAKPEVLEWLRRAYARPDAKQLYLHGSRARFSTFNQPDVGYGHLIFFSKLAEHPEFERSPLQAEYYGPNLYLATIAAGKVFDPHYVDREDRAIMAQALPADAWDREQKLQQGRLDYQDLGYVVPVAMRYGFEIFRVFEIAMGKDSYGVTNPALITIVDQMLTA
jgi:hypothetical protein